VLPFGATYEPLWLALGAVALDITVVVVATSLARTRISHRGWSLVHLTTYLAWCSAAAHGIGIGTDAGRPWMASMTAACVAAVVLAALARVTAVVRVRRRRAVAGGGVDALLSVLSGGAR
jgi:sulfoxide reductase heme-binding subunit YedZ